MFDHLEPERKNTFQQLYRNKNHMEFEVEKLTFQNIQIAEQELPLGEDPLWMEIIDVYAEMMMLSDKRDKQIEMMKKYYEMQDEDDMLSFPGAKEHKKEMEKMTPAFTRNTPPASTMGQFSKVPSPKSAAAASADAIKEKPLPPEEKK